MILLAGTSVVWGGGGGGALASPNIMVLNSKTSPQWLV